MVGLSKVSLTAFNNDLVRATNRFKALLRGRGGTGLGKDVYDPEPELLRIDEARSFQCEAQLRGNADLLDPVFQLREMANANRRSRLVQLVVQQRSRVQSDNSSTARQPRLPSSSVPRPTPGLRARPRRQSL